MMFFRSFPRLLLPLVWCLSSTVITSCLWNPWLLGTGVGFWYFFRNSGLLWAKWKAKSLTFGWEVLADFLW